MPSKSDETELSETKNLPIGIQAFETMREWDYLYVVKRNRSHLVEMFDGFHPPCIPGIPPTGRRNSQ